MNVAFRPPTDVYSTTLAGSSMTAALLRTDARTALTCTGDDFPDTKQAHPHACQRDKQEGAHMLMLVAALLRAQHRGSAHVLMAAAIRAEARRWRMHGRSEGRTRRSRRPGRAARR